MASDKISLRNGGLEGALVLLDLKIPEYYVGEPGYQSGPDRRRVIAFKNPDLIMTIYPDEGSENTIIMKTPQAYDAEFRQEVKSDAFLHAPYLREEGRLYRKIMSCYPAIKGLTESDLEREINAISERRKRDFEEGQRIMREKRT